MLSLLSPSDVKILIEVEGAACQWAPIISTLGANIQQQRPRRTMISSGGIVKTVVMVESSFVTNHFPWRLGLLDIYYGLHQYTDTL